MAASSGEGVSGANTDLGANIHNFGMKSFDAASSECFSFECEIEATVCTGFEEMAKEEIREKLNREAKVTRGRVNVTVSLEEVKKDVAIRQIRSIAHQIDWSLGLKVWSLFFNFPHPISVPQFQQDHAMVAKLDDKIESVQHGNVCDASHNVGLEEKQLPSNVAVSDKIADLHLAETSECISVEANHAASAPDADGIGSQSSLTGVANTEKAVKNPLLPSFRATCHRTGDHHSFQSPAAAANFGGEMHNMFGWNVDLVNYDIETVLCIDDSNVRVGLSLTRESLHKRDIAYFGPTTLRPTIAHGLLRMCRITPGDLVCDPMCGGGSIPVEAALSWPSAHLVCGDIDQSAVERALSNIEALNAKRQKKNLSGSRLSNWHLYPRVLHELARTSKLETGRVCLLTHDRKCLTRTLNGMCSFFRRGPTVGINIGGLAASVYMLYRNSTVVVDHSSQSTAATADSS